MWGVIIGEDLRYENDEIVTDFTKRASTDYSLLGIKKMYKENPKKALEIAENVIKNTYRTLMSRGQKGCYVYCVDKGLREYLKASVRNMRQKDMYRGLDDGNQVMFDGDPVSNKYPER